MNLKRLLKKYNKICKKASKVHEQILTIYEDRYLSSDIDACTEILNSLYGSKPIYNEKTVYSYEDTDSIKSEV